MVREKRWSIFNKMVKYEFEGRRGSGKRGRLKKSYLRRRI